MTSDGKVTIAAIGVGNRTRKYLTYVSGHPESVVLSAIVDTDKEHVDYSKATYGLSDSQCFTSPEEFFCKKRDIDAVIIGTPDQTHYNLCMSAIEKGYHVLLEKPIAQTIQEVLRIDDAARKAGVIVSVCYVLRYHPYYLKIKELLDSGSLGKIKSIDYRIDIGIDRITHTYVRGPWSRSEDTTPIFLSKACHDADMLIWLTGDHVRTVTSHSSPMWFRPENAPVGSSDRCISCDVERQCPFSAVDLYRRRREWTDNFIVPEGCTKDEVIEQELSSGRYGRCVYHCDNDVPDNQTAVYHTESGIAITLDMVGITRKDGRSFSIKCSEGEIIAENKTIVVKCKAGTEKIDMSESFKLPFHAYSDIRTVEDFLNCVADPSHPEPVSSIHDTLESQIVCVRTDESRLEGSSLSI